VRAGWEGGVAGCKLTDRMFLRLRGRGAAFITFVRAFAITEGNMRYNDNFQKRRGRC